MKGIAKRMTMAFGSGCIGGVTGSLAAWLAGLYGITKSLGVIMAPALSPEWLYPRLVWGGVWGFLFLLPMLRKSVLRRGVILSVGPTLVQLFVLYPHKEGLGVMGMGLGALTPLFVIAFNAVWGITAALWLRFAGEEA